MRLQFCSEVAEYQSDCRIDANGNTRIVSLNQGAILVAVICVTGALILLPTWKAVGVASEVHSGSVFSS